MEGVAAGGEGAFRAGKLFPLFPGERQGVFLRSIIRE